MQTRYEITKYRVSGAAWLLREGLHETIDENRKYMNFEGGTWHPILLWKNKNANGIGAWVEMDEGPHA